MNIHIPQRLYDLLNHHFDTQYTLDILQRCLDNIGVAVEFLQNEMVFLDLEEAKSCLQFGEFTVYSNLLNLFTNYTITNYEKLTYIDALKLQQIVYGDRPQLVHIVCNKNVDVSYLLPIRQYKLDDTNNIYVLDCVVKDSYEWEKLVNNLNKKIPIKLQYSYKSLNEETFMIPLKHSSRVILVNRILFFTN